MFSYVPCNIFHHEEVLNFVKDFFNIWWDDHVCFFSSLFIQWVIFTDFCILNHPCISGMKFIWSWWMIFLMWAWVKFASILLSIFAAFNNLSLFGTFCVFIIMWQEGFLFWFNQFGILWVSCTFMAISFFRLGTFSSMIFWRCFLALWTGNLHSLLFLLF